MTLEKTFQSLQKKKFFQDKFFLIIILISFLTNLFCWIYPFVLYQGHSDLIVLHFTISRGIDLSGQWTRILIYPLLSLGALIINFLFLFYFYLIRKKRLAFLLLLGLFIVQLFCAISILIISGFNS